MNVKIVRHWNDAFCRQLRIRGIFKHFCKIPFGPMIGELDITSSFKWGMKRFAVQFGSYSQPRSTGFPGRDGKGVHVSFACFF